MPKIQLVADDDEVMREISVPDGPPMRKDDVEDIADGIAQMLAECGFDLSVGSTGGIELEWYCAVDRLDTLDPDHQSNINISFNP